jgi:hypothetical protein
MGWACGAHVRDSYKIFVGKSGGRRPLGRPRRRLDNMKM